MSILIKVVVILLFHNMHTKSTDNMGTVRMQKDDRKNKTFLFVDKKKEIQKHRERERERERER